MSEEAKPAYGKTPKKQKHKKRTAAVYQNNVYPHNHDVQARENARARRFGNGNAVGAVTSWLSHQVGQRAELSTLLEDPMPQPLNTASICRRVPEGWEDMTVPSKLKAVKCRV